MKRMIMNILTTTGIALVILAIIALCYGGTVVFVATIFQALFLNILIYVGIAILNRREYYYPIVETGVKLGYVLLMVLVFGNIFGWYSSTPISVLIIMTIIIFTICIFLDIIHVKSEVKCINDILNKKE